MSRLRTFLAVEVDAGIRTRLVDLQERFARVIDSVKWVEKDNLHVTMLFLGDVDDRDLNDVCRAAARVCAKHRAFPASIQGVNVFGSLRRPRTLWAGVGRGSEELIALHGDLESAFIELGCYRREDRSFTPHVTLGRLGHDSRFDQLPETLEEESEWIGGEFEVDEVLVMSSQLTPRGPIYSVLSRAELGA